MMKKLLAIVVLGLLWSGNVYAEDKFLGKWISQSTNSVFEIIKEEDEYKMYILFSGRYFQEYKKKFAGSFKKKNVSYKGITIFIDQDFNHYEVKSTYKIKKGSLVIKAKGQNPFNKKSVNATTQYNKFDDGDRYTEGEILFGIQIGDNIKNYKTLTKINLGNDMVGYKEGVVIESPEPHPDFESYIVETVKDTNQIYRISAYLSSNRQKLSYGQCEALMQPFRNYIVEKYKKNYIPMDESNINLNGSITSNTTSFALVDKKTNIYDYVVWTSCDEPFSNSIGDKNQYIARISLLHEGLMKLGWANERQKKNKKIKKF
jgi:hypothetical protein